MCLYPKLIINPKYKPNKKNGGKPPFLIDERVKYVPIGCQKCIECRRKKAREWQTRLLEEIKTNKNGKFITLTFSNESISKIIQDEKLQELHGYELDNEIATKATRLFLERWRKKFKKSARHWLITELGHNGTENIHLHGIVFTNESYETIANIWNYGYIWPRKTTTVKTWVNEQTINYIIKYVTKIDEKHKHYTSKILTSPGIGKNYTNTVNAQDNKYIPNNTKEYYRTKKGHKTSLPIYYRNKLYTEKEREMLWIEKIDKGERWVMGEKIKEENWQQYQKLLKHYRKLNKQLGYGDDEKNWNEIEYENIKRDLMYEKRKNTKHVNSNTSNTNNHNNNNNI